MSFTGMILHEDLTADFVVIATWSSGNAKTGDMIQIWILCISEDPVKSPALVVALCLLLTACGNSRRPAVVGFAPPVDAADPASVRDGLCRLHLKPAP